MAAEWAWGREGEPPPDILSTSVSEYSALGGRDISIRVIAPAADSRRLWQMRLRQPRGKSLQIRSEVVVARGESRIQLTVAIDRVPLKFELAPDPIEVRRPNLVPALLSGFSCRAGGHVVEGEAC